jgi:wyosine [tRNA(Phe)-imidazoG37] synthetase (radical SAM superfamily)
VPAVKRNAVKQRFVYGPGPSRSLRNAVKQRFVYGPVPSRRLGFSLGVDILPFKTCSLDCVYCQLGPSVRTTGRRRAYFEPREVLAQIRAALASAPRVDHITFSGSGEPTLNKNLGRIIRGIKRTTQVPVAVLTNATLLSRKDVRAELLAADVVVPSLDAAEPRLFSAVNRPHPSLEAGRVIEGLARFRREFKGQIWLEIMLVRGVNDAPGHIRALKDAIARINPDRIQLNTVVRPPAEASARPLASQELDKIRRALGDRAEVVADFGKKGPTRRRVDLEGSITAMVKRRPVTAGDISASLSRPLDDVLKALGCLLESGRVRTVRHGRKTFYEPA